MVDVMHDQASPVFLVGATRSGTTLLRLMLDHHPQILNFGEFEYAVHQISEQGFPAMPDFYRYLDLDRMYRTRSWSIDPKLDYVKLVRSFLQQAADRAGKPIVGATVHSKLDYLPKIWPNARYIHLVRDPRDVARSCIGMGWAGNVWHGIPYWLEPVQRWQRLSANLPVDRQLVVRFEDLIADTKGELTRICEFVGTTYDAAMMDYHEDSRYTLPEASLTEQWRTKLSAEELQQIESQCHVQMQMFGYTPVSENLDPPSTWKRRHLTLDHRWKRIQRNLRVYGLARYAFWQLAKQMPYCALKRRILSGKNRFDQARLK